MLHPNDPGYVSFYNDVLTEISTIRHGYEMDESISSEQIIEQFEFWVEEDFFSPEFGDDVLYQSTALRILDLFENS